MSSTCGDCKTVYRRTARSFHICVPRPDLKKWFHVYVLKPASLFINQTVYLSTYLSIGLPIYLDIYRSIYSSIYLSIYLSRSYACAEPGSRVPDSGWDVLNPKCEIKPCHPKPPGHPKPHETFNRHPKPRALKPECPICYKFGIRRPASSGEQPGVV